MDDKQKQQMKDLLGKMDVTEVLGMLSLDQRLAAKKRLEAFTLTKDEINERMTKSKELFDQIRGLYEECGIKTKIGETDEMVTLFKVKKLPPKSKERLPALQLEEFQQKIWPRLGPEFNLKQVKEVMKQELGMEKDFNALKKTLKGMNEIPFTTSGKGQGTKYIKKAATPTSSSRKK